MPYPRREPSRRDRWKVRVAKTPTVPAAARLFLVTVLAPKMKADGTVSESRWKLARDANVSERRVTMFITQAKEAGWLVVVQPGYRSMTAVYQATFPDAESGNSVFSHSRPESGNKIDPLSAGTECSLIPAEKREQSVPTTSSTTTRPPLRVVESRTNAQSAHFASSLRLSSLTARQQNRNVWLSPSHLGWLQPGRRPSRLGGAARLALAGICNGDSRTRSALDVVKSKSAAKTEGLMNGDQRHEPRATDTDERAEPMGKDEALRVAREAIR